MLQVLPLLAPFREDLLPMKMRSLTFLLLLLLLLLLPISLDPASPLRLLCGSRPTHESGPSTVTGRSISQLASYRVW